MTQTTTPGQGSNIPLHASVSAHPDAAAGTPHRYPITMG